jgi:two-component system, NtrC family, response regulator HydG
VLDISENALKILIDYNWPGNVRELENAVERAIVTCKTNVLSEDDFGFIVLKRDTNNSWNIPGGITLQDVEKKVIEATLQRYNGNIKETASVLGIDRSTLYEKIKKYEIPRYKEEQM